MKILMKNNLCVAKKFNDTIRSKRNYARCHAVIGRFTDRFTLSECVCASVLYSKKY